MISAKFFSSVPVHYFGQACEFDYRGLSLQALREEGYEVILVIPIGDDYDRPDMADRTYIEPITWQVVEKIIAKERPDAILPPWRANRLIRQWICTSIAC